MGNAAPTGNAGLAVRTVSTLTTDIVVDVGCVTWLKPGQLGQEDSIGYLLKRFGPTVLYGFDPHPGLVEMIDRVDGAVVMTSRRAAWTYDGEIALDLQANCTHVDAGMDKTPCFDLARWLLELPKAEIVMKLDVEGAEYVLLPHLIETGAIRRVNRLLVEWHVGRYANGLQSDRRAIMRGIDCPVEEWQ
jgi:hypothetical protein